MRATKWDRKVATLRQDSGQLGIPVSARAIAEHLGIHVMPYKLGDDVSGVLIRENGHATIGYNEHQAPVRQRFTIAHEIGHFIFHEKQDNLFVDHNFTVKYRDGRSSTGRDLQEREANAFAAALLMPLTEVKQAARDVHFDLMDDRSVSELAKKFNVSQQSMSFRLARVLSEPR